MLGEVLRVSSNAALISASRSSWALCSASIRLAFSVAWDGAVGIVGAFFKLMNEAESVLIARQRIWISDVDPLLNSLGLVLRMSLPLGLPTGVAIREAEAPRP